jgi:7,8-dihydro-6-hydroxymethylpterin-pyrophosphokinase
MTTSDKLREMKDRTSNKKKIVSTSIYHIEQLKYEDGSIHLNRTCEGFTPLELIGMLELTLREVIEQMQGKYRPDVITRKYVKHG